jgi:hypothetical protein
VWRLNRIGACTAEAFDYSTRAEVFSREDAVNIVLAYFIASFYLFGSGMGTSEQNQLESHADLDSYRKASTTILPVLGPFTHWPEQSCGSIWPDHGATRCR